MSDSSPLALAAAFLPRRFFPPLALVAFPSFAFFADGDAGLRLNELRVPSSEDIPLGLRGVAGAGEAFASAAMASPAAATADVRSTIGSGSGSGSGSGRHGHLTRNASPLAMLYHWLYLGSWRTKLRVAGACSTSPSMTVYASLPSSSSSTMSGVWHTSASSLVPAGMIDLWGMTQVSGALEVATPQCRMSSASLSVSTRTRNRGPLHSTATLTCVGTYSRMVTL